MAKECFMGQARKKRGKDEMPFDIEKAKKFCEKEIRESVK